MKMIKLARRPSERMVLAEETTELPSKMSSKRRMQIMWCNDAFKILVFLKRNKMRFSPYYYLKFNLKCSEQGHTCY